MSHPYNSNKIYKSKSRHWLSTSVLLTSLLFVFTTQTFAKEREVSNTSLTFTVDNTPVKINYFSSPALDVKNDKITNLVMVVHGTGRNPFTYHKNMRIAADLSGAGENTLVVAPGFIMEKDLMENKDLLSDDHVFWTNAGWKKGDNSLVNSKKNKRSVSISSYEMMDKMVAGILASEKFPNIKSISIAGNSAGGQYVNRYLASNQIHDAIKAKYNIEIKYLIAAPSSYAYLTPERPVIGKAGEFYVPKADVCEKPYNNYTYGLDNVNEFLAKTGAEKIKQQYGTRKVAYFVGALDNDPNGKSLDKSCASMLEGTQRKERAELFVGYLTYLYGEQRVLHVVPDAAHDHAKMFASEPAQQWLFH